MITSIRITKTIITATVLLAAVLYSVGPLTMPGPVGGESDKFSAERVAADIEVISRQPHSIRAPQQQRAVAEFLATRLYEASGTLPQALSYEVDDSTTLTNLYLTVDPPSGKATSYVMLVAHYDSALRFSPRTKQIEPSHGAADDGYGVGVILETLRCAISSGKYWHQGIKILLTDGEEFGMLGMKEAWQHKRDFFDNTLLLINVEARGVKGPALLFETSAGNSRITDLYVATAKYPTAYSLSSTIYGILPNYTDFTIVRDSICGINFSVIDNLYYYHTCQDNFDNISKRSIQHYGEQITPMVTRLLTDPAYGDPEYFRSDEDSIYFFVAAVGVVVMSQAENYTINALTVMLIILASVLVLRAGMRVGTILKSMLFILLYIVVAFATGTGVAYVVGAACGVEYKLIGMSCSAADYPIIVAYCVVVATAAYAVLLRWRRYIDEFRIAALWLNAAVILIMVALLPDNFFILIPTLISLLIFVARLFMRRFGVIMYIISVIGGLFIIFTVAPILNHLAVGLAIGATGVVAALLLIVLSVTLPIAITPQKRS